MNERTILGERWRKQRARCAALGKAGHSDSSAAMIEARAELHTIRYEQRLTELVAETPLSSEQRARLIAVLEDGDRR